ncbi:unnamed protein product [Candidula unifasciata]|uniref:Uncharacterized protein n=1 Tax=Candidula unifasciata TaxID=100452 RepID=A0A8S3ZKS2_9EUPU|nr:unnamed protein product [Candidula unifasciata]
MYVCITHSHIHINVRVCKIVFVCFFKGFFSVVFLNSDLFHGHFQVKGLKVMRDREREASAVFYSYFFHIPSSVCLPVYVSPVGKKITQFLPLVSQSYTARSIDL